jgi:hypothetical protein
VEVLIIWINSSSTKFLVNFMEKTPLGADWVYKEVPIYRLSKERMVNIANIWKAEGEPSRYRPDKWLKSEEIQEKLEAIAKIVGDGLARDEKGKIIKLPGLLEVRKGGRYLQGTFVSYDLAIDYTQRLSIESHIWFAETISKERLKEDKETKSQESSIFPVNIDDFGEDIRFTPDGWISVYDGISAVLRMSEGLDSGIEWRSLEKKRFDDLARKQWERIQDKYSEVVTRCHNFRFSGKGQRDTPVADLQTFGEILVVLPGQMAARIRSEAVRTLIRAMKGDPTLIEEILDRIQNPEDLLNIEESIRARRIQAYGSDTPIAGTIDNPLTEVTPEIKSGYGWENKVKQMVDLLTELAVHRGMFIQRESNHRAYSSTGKDKSRRIDLVLRTMENQETLHIYKFESTYIDDSTVVEAFAKRAYPELAHRDFSPKDVKYIVAHLVAPGGITQAAVGRLREIQAMLDAKYGQRICLDAMRLDELVWGEMYPAIEEKYQDASGRFGNLHLNSKIKKLCKQLCEKNVSLLGKSKSEQPRLQQSEAVQLELFKWST